MQLMQMKFKNKIKNFNLLSVLHLTNIFIFMQEASQTELSVLQLDATCYLCLQINHYIFSKILF